MNAPQQFLPNAGTSVPAIANNVFGLVIPQRPPITEFREAAAGKFVVELPQPATIGQVCLFLQPGQALAPDKGVVVYWSYPPFNEWLSLGTLTADQPSTIITTGWPGQQEIRSMPSVQIGCSVESVDMVQNLRQALDGPQATLDRLGFARLVAQNLFRYLESFAQTTPQGDVLALPADALDRWMRRFEGKYHADPQFLQK